MISREQSRVTLAVVALCIVLLLSCVGMSWQMYQLQKSFDSLDKKMSQTRGYVWELKHALKLKFTYEDEKFEDKKPR